MVIANFGVEHTFVDLRDAAALRSAIRPNTKVSTCALVL